MLFQYTCDKVMDGTKTQTRRLKKPGERLLEDIGWPVVIRPSVPGQYRHVYAVGNTYAVQPGRGEKAVGRIRVLKIREEDVRDISEADAKAEGFDSPLAFLETWVMMHDKAITFFRPYLRMNDDFVYDADGQFTYAPYSRLYVSHKPAGARQRPLWRDEEASDEKVWDTLRSRPLTFYTAWVLEFERAAELELA